MIIILIPCTLSNNALAQSLHNQTLAEVVKQISVVDEDAYIDVGKSPSAVGIFYDEVLNSVRVYIANGDSNTVSVISGENNTKIGEDIPVGDNPMTMTVWNDLIYVVNEFSSTVSVISGENNTVIKEVPVGDNPTAIDIGGEDSATVFVANSDSDTVSVISGENNTVIKEVPVGDNPTAMDIGGEDSATVFVANSDSDTVSVISGENNTVIKEVPVGDNPTAIDARSDFVYVVNTGSNTVSVISGENNTVIKEVPVGDNPTAIGSSFEEEIIYVTNSHSDTVSVISGENKTVIKEVPVGDNPREIELATIPITQGESADEFIESVYILNRNSDTVSVISGENNTKIGEDIPVGDNPRAISANSKTDTLYVANRDSGSISVIDGIANKVVAGITFQVNPFNSGYVLCEGLTTPSPIRQYVYVDSGTECTAKPSSGFEFVSWEENLSGNSTQLIKLSRPASSWDSFVLAITALYSANKPDEPEAKFNVTRFGTFTVNFKELPPAVPSEYWIPLYGIIATTIVGWSIPSIIGWTKSRSDLRKLNGYHKQIASLYSDGKLDEKDIGPLDRLTSSILDAYSKGKINERHYESLRSEISILYEKIFRKRIEDILIRSSSNDPATVIDTKEQLAEIRKDVKYAYSDGKINDKHYDLLNKDILDMADKNDYKQ
jgi:YVTN family beta-propeller protein